MAVTNIEDLPPEAQRFMVIFKEHGGSARKFAEVFGLTHTTVLRMLNGKFGLTFHVLQVACFKLGYSPKWLLTGQGPKKQKMSEQGEIIADIAMFQTTIEIINQRVEILSERVKHLEAQLESRTSKAG